MLRRPLFAVLIFALALVALPLLSSSRAEAGPTLGVSQSYRDFGLNLTRSGNYEISHDVSSSFYWNNAGLGTMRVIVPWDLGLRPETNGRRREFQNWLNRVTAIGGQPYVVLGPTEERTNLYDSRQPTIRKDPEGPVAPSPQTYRAAVKAFLKLWGPKGEKGKLRLLGAWNEPNLNKIDMSIPNGIDGKIYLPTDTGMGATATPMTSYKTCGDGYVSHCGPLLAGLYWWYAQQEMQAACSGTGLDCYVVAGEFASAPASSEEGKPYWETYADEIDRLISARPQIISFHAHRDVHALGEHRFIKDGKVVDHDCRPGNESWCITAMFYKWLKEHGGAWANRSNMAIWSTEVGAAHALGNPPWGETADGAQLYRFEFLYSLSTIYRVKRLYYFNFQTAGDTDRGLIAQGSQVNTTVRPIWQFFRSINCPNNCSGPKHLGSIILESEEPYVEPPLPEEDPEVELLPPTVETGAVTGVRKAEATFNGTVNPEGQPTTYYFQYGTTAAYGSTIPTGGASAGADTSTSGFSVPVSGLRPGTTYHVRIVASSPAGTSYGADVTFTTKPLLVESDVNGDGRSDLVALNTNGNVYDYPGQANGYLGSGVSSGGGLIDPAQADGNGYYPIDVEDVNGDAYDDLVTMHSSGTVYTYLGQAGGSFTAAVASLSGSLVPSILMPNPGEYEPIGVGDTTGDGRGDLVVYNNVDKTVYTYPGQSNGTFSNARIASLPGIDSAHFDSDGYYFLDVADVDGDSLADLVAQGTNNQVRIVRATGSGGFQAEAGTSGMHPSMQDGYGFEPVAVADVNGDGYGDLVTHHSNGTLSTYLGTAEGSFSTRIDTPGSFDSDLFDGVGTELGTVIDINGDGYSDLVTTKRADGNVYVLAGQSDGSFGAATTNSGGTYASTRANRKQGWQMAMEKPIRRRDGCRPNGCGLDPKSDVDGDHRADIVALHSSGTVNTYRGQLSGILSPPVSSHGGELDPAQYDGSGYYPVSVEDINGDSRDDLVSMHSSGTVYTFLGQAGGTVTTTVTSLTNALAPSTLWPGVGEFEPIGVGDTTGDHRGDLVLFNNSDRTVYTYPGQANGGFSSIPATSLTLASGGGGVGDSAFFDSDGDYFIDVADVNGDGLSDLVAQGTNGNGETYLATGSGGFLGSPLTSFAGTAKPSLATGTGYEPVAVADVNGDGRADFVAHGSGGTLSTYLGQANGTFATRADTFGAYDSNLFDGTGAELGTVIDVNGDGYGDLVFTKGDGRLYVQKGRRDGTFGTAEGEAEGGYSSTRHNRTSGSQMVNEQPLRRRSACASNGCGLDLRSDVNGDHRGDLVTLHTSGSAYTYRGQVNGEFAAGKVSSMTLASGSNGVLDPAQYDGVGYYPLGVDDVNGDHYDDFVTVDSAGTVTTFTGQVDGGFSGAEIDSLEGQLPPAILAPSPGRYEPIGLGDATGDGRTDLVVFENTEKVVYTYPGQANGKFSSARVASQTLASGTGYADSALFDSVGDYFLGVADVNGDGLSDLVAHATNGNGETYVATGGGAFSATPVVSFAGTVNPSLATGTGYEPIAVADVNGDGRADFVTHHSSGTVYTYLGQANGAFTSRIASSGAVDSNLYDGTGSELGTVLDVNGDGFGDLISANRSDGNVYIQLGRRNGSFGYGWAQLGGTYVSTRHSQASGQQMVGELPLRRRSACAANGCH